jgi:hypothetical protein
MQAPESLLLLDGWQHGVAPESDGFVDGSHIEWFGV